VRHYAAQAERVGGEVNRLVARIAAAAADAFNAPVEPFSVKPPEIDLRSIAFDLAAPMLALDANEWAVPLSDFFVSPHKVVRRATRRAAGEVDDWLRQNLHRMDRVMVDWLDRSAKQLVDSLRARLDGMGQEILDVVNAGRRRHEAGEETARRRLAELEAQRATIAEITRRTDVAAQA
jgi:hypothetical protein